MFCAEPMKKSRLSSTENSPKTVELSNVHTRPHSLHSDMVMIPQFQYKFYVMVAVKKLLNEWIHTVIDEDHCKKSMHKPTKISNISNATADNNSSVIDDPDNINENNNGNYNNSILIHSNDSNDNEQPIADENSCEYVADVQPLGSFIMDGGFVFSNFNMIAVIPNAVPWRNRIDLRFVQMLHRDPATFKNIRVLQDAYVPALRFQSQNIDVDIIFCHLGNAEIRDASSISLTEPSTFVGLSEVSLRALNSLRNCRNILDSVPNQAIYDAALQLIKIWAYTHDIYSSSMGYLGGISWCLMTAYVYLIFPQSTILGLVYGFFHVFANWNWDEPVVLPGAVGVSSLDSTVKKPMQIMTPCRPVQNSSFTVTKSARRHIIRLLSEANAKVESIGTLGESWSGLFVAEHALKFYHYFLKISIHYNVSFNADTIEFADFVESKLRLVINNLEEKNLRSTRLWTRRQTLQHEVFWLIGVTLPVNKHLLHVREVKKYFVDYLHRSVEPQMSSYISRLQFSFLTWTALTAENPHLSDVVGKPSISKTMIRELH